MRSYSTIVRATVWLVLLGSALGQAEDDRNCSSDDTFPYPFPGDNSVSEMNATGTFEFKGFGNQTDPAAEKQWTWSTGVQEFRNSTTNDTVYQRPIWLDTQGTNLASEDLGYNLCYLMQFDHTQSLQKRGKGDKGDCTTFFNQQCVDDWKKVMSDLALRFDETATIKTPCEAASRQVPKSCQEFKGGAGSYGGIPAFNRTCPFGEGSPNLDIVSQTTRFASDPGVKRDPEDFTAYDKLVTAIIPLIAVAWTNNTNTSNWADVRVMCLSAPNITEGSRTPAGVPSLASVSRANMLGLAGGVFVLMLL